MNQKLLFARAYEREAAKLITDESRPLFHLTPYTGWMNDPNGFSLYQGKYHLFYQYNPYDTVWDAMHWGHAVTTDLLHWSYLPTALAPDEWYDGTGVFSGSAEELADGRQILLYTGVRRENGDKESEVQIQCVAIGDGVEYQKIPENPVITENMLPEGFDKMNFRDPKILKLKDGSFRAVMAACRDNGLGAILSYRSADGISWTYEGILLENDGNLGLMWECPDLFELDGKTVMLLSLQDMLPEGFEFHNGNGTAALIGHFDEEKKRFVPESIHSIDYGIDFYAPQTIRTPDGRRVMIGWMQNWDTTNLISRKGTRWFGQMTLPREIFLKDGRLYQRPIRELEAFRSNPVRYDNVRMSGDVVLPGVSGRTVELELTVRPVKDAPMYHKFAVHFMRNEKFRTSITYRPHESVLRIDRKFSGSRRAYIHQRRCLVPSRNGEIKIHLILDRFSVEAFLNDGEQVVTATVLTELSATGIAFYVDGEAEVDVCKYDLFQEEKK